MYNMKFIWLYIYIYIYCIQICVHIYILYHIINVYRKVLHMFWMSLILDGFPPVRMTTLCITRTFVFVGLGAAFSVTQILAASAPECQPPTEPAEREVKVPLRAGGRAGYRLDQEFERLKVKSTIRPSLPQDLVAGATLLTRVDTHPFCSGIRIYCKYMSLTVLIYNIFI